MSNTINDHDPNQLEKLTMLRFEIFKYERELKIFLDLEAVLKKCTVNLTEADVKRLRDEIQAYVAKDAFNSNLQGFVKSKKDDVFRGQSLACKQPNGSIMVARREHKLGNLISSKK